jgi:hypothetical protein
VDGSLGTSGVVPGAALIETAYPLSGACRIGDGWFIWLARSRPGGGQMCLPPLDAASELVAAGPQGYCESTTAYSVGGMMGS